MNEYLIDTEGREYELKILCDNFKFDEEKGKFSCPYIEDYKLDCEIEGVRGNDDYLFNKSFVCPNVLNDPYCKCYILERKN